MRYRFSKRLKFETGPAKKQIAYMALFMADKAPALFRLHAGLTDVFPDMALRAVIHFHPVP